MAGETIIRKGEIADELYFIKKGKVAVLSTDTDSVIACLMEGAYFGEVGFFDKDQKRSVTVVALSFCLF